MDVAKLLAGATLLSLPLIIGACAQNGSEQSVGFVSSSVQCESTEIKNSFVVKWKDGDVTVEKYDSKEAMQADLDEISEYIDYVEQDHTVSMTSPASGGRAAGAPTAQAAPTADWGQTIVQAPAVWAQGIKGDGVKVAIVDTGIDITHPQLVNQIAINTVEQSGRTGVDDDGNGYIDDVYGYNFSDDTADVTDLNGHGSHVSGIVAADPTAGQIKGMAPDAKLVAAPFMDVNGSGSMGAATQAILYAVSRGAKVINASWGGSGCSTTLEAAIAHLQSSGVVFVVAAGNDGVNLNVAPAFPAAFGLDSQITVGASGTSDFMAYFSNYSTTLVHLLAPGMSIYSTVPTTVNSAGYESMDGTSMATPFVTGSVALLMSAVPSATIDQIKASLVNSVDHGNFPVISSGRLNIAKAVALLKQSASSSASSANRP